METGLILLVVVTAALATGALSTDAAMGSAAPFRPEIHELRGHALQIEAAHTLRTLMTGSVIGIITALGGI